MPEDFNELLEQHGKDVARLFGLLCQIYSGGKGIADLGSAIVEAANSFAEVSDAIEAKRGQPNGEWWNAQQKACQVVADAIDLKDDRPDSEYSQSFDAKKIKITKEAAKLVAHLTLGHPGNGSRASDALMNTVVKVGEYHTSKRRGRG